MPIKRQVARFPTGVVRNPRAESDIGFSDVQNMLYSATLRVNGRQFQVQVDSGSSDLWIDASALDLPGVHHTGYNSTTEYGDGSSAGGEIVLANVTMGEFTVVNQAMTLSPGSNATGGGLCQGLLGVGPYAGSEIYRKLNNTEFNGANFLTNIFNLVPDEPAYMTFLLSRTNTGVTQGGVLSFGELVSNLTHIKEAPKLPILTNSGWLTVSDGVLVNGKYHGAHTVNTAVGKKSLAMIDTGTTVGVVPRDVLDFMYQDLPGAVWLEDESTYQIPCNTKVNISMVFSGVPYPIHPIDAVIADIGDNGTVSCYAAWEAKDNGLMILGDTFMRNVYTLFHFGDKFTMRSGDRAPHMQLLSVTDPESAWKEYEQLNARRIADLVYEKFAQDFKVETTTALSATSTAASQYTLVRHHSKATITAFATGAPAPTAIAEEYKRRDFI
ncbi:aspartic peptidase domain-containing protein [Fomitopsis betulina]|nr:aspartic peptidase domain-containing protein [Fomitopsis betulina]